MAPPPKLTVSQWADEHRHLSGESSAEPGRWDTGRAEYQRGIMDAVSDPRADTVVVMSSAQVGKTEFINNLVGYHIHQDPAPILVIQPTTEMGEAWSKDRLAPMLRDSPALRGRVSEAKARSGGNTLRQKKFPGGHLAIAGANSAASLASRPIRILCCDEVDRYPASAGSEGDPVTLGRKRTTTFWNRKVVLVSTPTISGASRIEAAYEASDQRRFWVPCPHCGEEQTLKWPQVRWDATAGTAAYVCKACEKPWSDTQRWAAVRRGEWRAGAPFNGTAGFHLNELYSPWRRLAETVQDFLDAKGKPELLKVWTNTALGETWRERGDAPEWERLLERREEFPVEVVPAGALVLTAGVDRQGDRLEVSIWGWGPGLERWLVTHIVIAGSPSAAGPWDDLQALLDRNWPCEDGGTMQVSMACCDTGGHDTAAIYGHIRRLADRRIVAIKGVDGWNRAAPVMGPTSVDAMVDGRKIKRGLKLFTVAVSTFKAELYRALWLKRGDEGYPPGWVHLPKGADAEVIKQLTAEELRTVKDRRGFSRQEWAKIRERNEVLDCAVYARAALWLAGADRLGARFWARREAEMEAAKAAPAASIAVEAASDAPTAGAEAPRAALPKPSGSYFRPRAGSFFGGRRE
nr:phage terminase large subunit family protein [uncultured Roseococcus sp.]